MKSSTATKYRISVLVFIRDENGRHLLIKRSKSPNMGLWSPIGGKLEMGVGESPHECAVRETHEETGLELEHGDLHLFCMIAEKDYEGTGHWLMFLFDCRKRLSSLPPAIQEGPFAFHADSDIDALALPETDRDALWPIYRKYRDGFVALRADCAPGRPLRVVEEERIGI